MTTLATYFKTTGMGGMDGRQLTTAKYTTRERAEEEIRKEDWCDDMHLFKVTLVANNGVIEEVVEELPAPVSKREILCAESNIKACNKRIDELTKKLGRMRNAENIAEVKRDIANYEASKARSEKVLEKAN